MNARRWFVGLVLICVSVGTASLRGVELAPEQRDKLVWIDQSLQKVVTLYREKKTDDMQKLIGEIETAISAVQSASAGQDVEAVLNPFRVRLASAQKLAAYVPPVVATVAKPKPKPGMPLAMPTGTAPPPPAPGAPIDPNAPVSFVRQIAPLLVGKCGGCHVNNSSGMLNFATYPALMAGTKGEFIIVRPGMGQASVIVEKIANGEMPPGNGNAVSDMELATLTRWINEGAKFDGPDPTVSIRTLLPGTGPAGQTPPPALARATGNEKVKFVRHVVPILMKHCFDCHSAVNGNDNRGGASFRTMTALLRGGDNGPNIKPGDPDGSLMIHMLKGTGKSRDGTMNLQKMPAGRRPPLSTEEMDTLVTWIREGAKFDDDDPNEANEFLYRVDVAKLATHEELLAMRMDDSKKQWTRSNRDSAYEVLETNDFLILSNVGPVRMQEYLKLAEDEKAKLTAELKLPTDKPLVKGRITLFIFDKKFEYSEFGTVVERRQLPPGLTSHWFFNFIESYAALVAQPTTEETAPLISAAVAGSFIDSLGSKAPRWFTIGVARNLAAKIHSKTDIVKQWEDGLMAAASANLTVNAIIATSNPDLNAMAVSQAFVKDLMKSPGWATLVSGIVKGAKFNETFQAAYRTDPQKLFEQWMQKFK